MTSLILTSSNLRSVDQAIAQFQSVQDGLRHISVGKLVSALCKWESRLGWGWLSSQIHDRWMFGNGSGEDVGMYWGFLQFHSFVSWVLSSHWQKMPGLPERVGFMFRKVSWWSRIKKLTRNLKAHLRASGHHLHYFYHLLSIPFVIKWISSCTTKSLQENHGESPSHPFPNHWLAEVSKTHHRPRRL